ncbi:cellulose biosynthesis protein BcsO [Enterobacteriaceae bacterium H20N1]|uniref:Cellulose biosynthesis protein BcsO n=1 Tax=Dryocola boscaweniae TaxID=2925397 RepID=A0A9X2WAP3_9ENTR|nr:cellulose biosynthesis protein BcsO [Dryocola boscaweniae]MCT4703317.1 cellulose biosynthesis protein BcsO [Dryocola boscaweniae]MCT4720485.1 cellulose biosynthesis protein BcsO [Dryocola boscaweniae]
MKSYDDLQRFKDKTRTGAIGFKDMSAQTQQLSTSNWAIIKQLSGDNDDSVLAQAGSVAVPVPQAIKPGEFDAAFAKPIPAQVIEPVGAHHSILGSLNAAMPVEKAAENSLPEEKPAAASLFAQLTPAAAAPAPSAAPAFEPAKHYAAPAKAEPVRFEQLFAAKGATTTNHPAKDLPLQPLLEMIASCR